MFSVNFNEDLSDPTSSDSESSNDDEKTLQQRLQTPSTSHRSKREIVWCDVETDFVPYPEPQPLNVSGPSSSNGSRGSHFENPTTNPVFGNRMQLYSRTRHYLAVYPNGKVRGTLNGNDLYTHLELVSARYPGHLVIKGLLTNLFVSMNDRGRAIAQPNADDERAVFIETINGFYMTYLSRKFAHIGWYLAIKKSGRMKNGKKTQLRQKAVQFIKQRKPFK